MKNRKTGRAIAAAAALTIATMTLPTVPAAADGETITPYQVLVLGDSISTGYGLADASQSYVSLLEQSMNQKVTNLAQDGMTTAELLQLLQTDATLQGAVASADVILVSIGANDVLQPILDNDVVSIKDYSTITELAAAVKANQLAFQRYLMKNIPPAVATANENINNIILQLQSTNSNAKLAFQTIYDPASIEDDETGLSSSAISTLNLFSSGLVYQFLEGSLNGNTLVPVGLNENIRDQAAAGSIYAADIYTAFKGHAWTYTNISNADVHPNAAGHAVIAEMLLASGYLPTVTEPVYKLGDVDGDGKVAVEDAVAALTEYARVSAALGEQFTPAQKAAADIDGDGIISVEDAVRILSYYAKQSAGLNPSFDDIM